LDTDRFGFPVLPGWKDIEGKPLQFKKTLIGKFMTTMYRA
jgi:hypothetical protein